MKTVLFFIAMTFAASGIALAEAGEIYECKFKPRKGTGISEKVFISVGSKSGRVTAYDGMIHYVSGKPIVAKIATDNNKRLIFKWNMFAPDVHGRSAKLNYRLTYLKKNRKAVIHMNVSGFENQSSAHGTCKIERGQV